MPAPIENDCGRTSQERAAFERQLREATETVSLWPAWKQRAVSESVRIPIQPQYRTSSGVNAGLTNDLSL